MRAGDDAGVRPIWLYHRPRNYGRFAVAPMLDDGSHGDGDAGDGVYGAAAPASLADARVRCYYIERARPTPPGPPALRRSGP